MEKAKTPLGESNTNEELGKKNNLQKIKYEIYNDRESTVRER